MVGDWKWRKWYHRSGPYIQHSQEAYIILSDPVSRITMHSSIDSVEEAESNFCAAFSVHLSTPRACNILRSWRIVSNNHSVVNTLRQLLKPFSKTPWPISRDIRLFARGVGLFGEGVAMKTKK